ncbi:VMAP-C domain-containing protein [Kitasatospora sp. NPDC001664]
MEILLGFHRMSRLSFRQDVLEAMGRSEPCRGFDSDVEESNQARAHVRTIVATLRRHRDPGAALEALCRALRDHAPDDGALAWLELTVLGLTRECGLPTETLLRFVRLLRALAAQPAPERLRRHLPEGVSGLTLLPADATLPEVVRRLMDRRGTADPGPVLHFLDALTTDPALQSDPQVDSLRTLLVQVGGSGRSAASRGAHRLIVQIRLDPETPEHIDNCRYLLRASYYRQPLTGGRFRRIDTLGASTSLAKDELIAEGSARLAGWASLVAEMRSAVGSQVRIEFLLPASLLGHSAELWSPSRNGQRLGHHYPVVVRSLDRYADPWLDPVPWRDRWQHLFAESIDQDVLDRIEWPSLLPEQAADLPKWLAGRPTLACMGLNTPYEELDPRVRRAVDNAIFIDGVPVMLWRRIAGDPKELVSALRERCPISLAQLPELVHQHRKDTREAVGQEGITLLWDDPDCVDPDQDAPYPGMV